MSSISTYASEQGYDPFDWEKFLSTTQSLEHEWHEAEQNAMSSVLDPAACLTSRIDRDRKGFPKDDVIKKYSAKFYGSICFRDKTGAKEHYESIKIRITQLTGERQDA